MCDINFLIFLWVWILKINFFVFRLFGKYDCFVRYLLLTLLVESRGCKSTRQFTDSHENGTGTYDRFLCVHHTNKVVREQSCTGKYLCKHAFNFEKNRMNRIKIILFLQIYLDSFKFECKVFYLSLRETISFELKKVSATCTKGFSSDRLNEKEQRIQFIIKDRI